GPGVELTPGIAAGTGSALDATGQLTTELGPSVQPGGQVFRRQWRKAQWRPSLPGVISGVLNVLAGLASGTGSALDATAEDDVLGGASSSGGAGGTGTGLAPGLATGTGT